MPSETQRWGAAREALAEEALARAGYAVVERNWRGGGGEVDRIAWREGVLCFIEVRARSSAAFGDPAETVSFRKQRKIVRAARMYMVRFGPGQTPMARFDVVSIVDRGALGLELTIFPGAFDARPG